VACVVPSGLVIVPSVPVTPDPAVAGPFTGGQNVAHDPVHLDVVEVSGTNQYKVKPAELVSTFVPLIVVLINVLPDELAAGLDAPAAGGVLLELAELPQAAIASTAAANAAAPNIPRMCRVSFTKR
jgi:hypothetical protein